MKRFAFLMHSLPFLSFSQSSERSICRGDQNLSGLPDGEISDQLKVLWTFKADNYINGGSVIYGHYAYFGNYDVTFFKTDLERKKITWKNEQQGSYVASPVVNGTKAIIGPQNRYVYYYDTESDDFLWKFKTLRKVESSPIIAKDKVLITSTEERIYV